MGKRGILWYKCTFVKVVALRKWSTLGKLNILGHKYTVVKVGISVKLGTLEQECSAILDLLTIPFAHNACKV